MKNPAPNMPCTHHWLIDSGPGDQAPGVCKLCGETRTFANRVDYHGRTPDPSTRRSVSLRYAAKLTGHSSPADFY